MSNYYKNLAKIYKLLGWHWKDNPKPPTEKEIMETIIGLLKSVALMKNAGGASTGGLNVSKFKDEISIKFEYEEPYPDER